MKMHGKHTTASTSGPEHSFLGKEAMAIIKD